MPSLLLAYLINWGWLRIGPPYIYININPVIFQIGPLAVRWYGLMYVVGIIVGLQVITGYLARKGIGQEILYRTLWWGIAAGLLGGRLYFVIQQHDLVQHYLLQPWHILATWEGGMAFFGAIFLVLPIMYWRARIEHINPLVYMDAVVLFATAGQIFGRIGNLINGDIIGYRSTLPWSTVYVNPNSWACNPYVILGTCNTPVQPAAGYELLSNLILLAVMLYLARRLTRPGILMLVYLFSYCISQFLLFFVRENTIEAPFGLNWGLKQAQWTSLVVFIILFPITYWVLRTSKPVPAGEVAAHYGIPQPVRKIHQQESVVDGEKDEETLHLEQDPLIGSEETEVLPHLDPILGSEETEVLFPPDLIANCDDADIALHPDPDALDDSNHPDPITDSDHSDHALNSGSDPIANANHADVHPDPIADSDNADHALNSGSDPIGDANHADVHPDPITDSDHSDYALNSGSDPIGDANHTGVHPDPIADSDHSDHALNSGSDPIGDASHTDIALNLD